MNNNRALQRPIVVRRKTAAHGGNHGVWKIAYADFMTAMMAFFLVMWLLGSLSSQELKNVSEYFSTPLSVALTGGDRAAASDSVIPGGGDDPTHADGEVRKSRPNPDRQKIAYEHNRLKRLKAELQAQIEQDPRLNEMSAQIKISIVPDGLLIQVSDSEARPMFKVGSAHLEPDMRHLLKTVVPLLDSVDNKITLTGHTDDLPYAAGPAAYGNWELSADRANAARRTLMEGGMRPLKILRVIGAADTQPVEGGSANLPINRRISLLLLNDAAQRRIEMRERPVQPPMRPHLVSQGDARVALDHHDDPQAGGAIVQ